MFKGINNRSLSVLLGFSLPFFILSIAPVPLPQPVSIRQPPTVTTLAATNVTGTSATLNGELISLGASTWAVVYFQWGLTTAYGNITLSYQLNQPGTFSDGIYPLTPWATYHYRAVASSYQGISYGEDMTFTAVPIPPVVATLAATNVTGTSATLNGELISLGASTWAVIYFQWGLTTAYGNITLSYQLNEPGTFSGDIYPLTPWATYHYRAVAYSDEAIAYGEDMFFITKPLYTLTIAVNGNGNTDPAVGPHTYSAGTVVNITATPDAGYCQRSSQVKEWSALY